MDMGSMQPFKPKLVGNFGTGHVFSKLGPTGYVCFGL